MMYDLRLAYRALRATPLVSIVAILSLALGIGANTAIFSIVDSLLLRALPVKQPERLVLLAYENDLPAAWTNPIWEQIRDRPQLFDGALAWSSTRFDLAQGGQTEFVDGIWASGHFFDVLGVPAILGRTLTEGDDRRGGGPDGAVAVISYSFWQRRFGGAADAIGRSLTVSRIPYTIVGVAGPDFFGPDVGRTFDIVIPIGTEPLVRGKESSLDQRSHWWLNVMARLKPGQTVESATASLRAVQPQIREATMPQNWRPEHKASYLNQSLALKPAATGASGLRRRYQRPLLTILVVVGLVLLIACANIANLLLARATARRHELSVRLALGASRLRLARQLLAESLLLSGMGAALGLVFAQWVSSLLVSQLSTQTNYVFLDLSLDGRVLGFTAAIGIGTAVLFGTAPAFQAARVPPIEAMKEHGRGVSGDARASLGSALVIAQVALSLMLVVAAGLFIRTFASLANLNLGFDRNGVLVVTVNAQRLQLEPAARAALYERVQQAVLPVPGIANLALSVITPVSGSAWNDLIVLPDGPPLPERDRMAYRNMVSPGWFETYRTPIRTGRDFTQADRAGAPQVAIVNETFARRYFNGQNPIGRTFRLMDRPDKAAPLMEIVGLAGDAVYRSLRDPVPPTMYFPIPQADELPSSISLSVRAAGGSPAMLTRAVAAAIGDVNRDLSLTFRPLADQVDAAVIQERLVAMLSGFFGALALLLAGLGLYGVTSYAVTRRRTEIGIRMALGAAPAGVVRLVLRRVAVLVGMGIIAGAGASLWASRFVATLLYGTQPWDVSTLAAAIAVLAAIGALAGFLPARRASRIDPARVLREG
jgi:putative ABC transport system permease protein